MQDAVKPAAMKEKTMSAIRTFSALSIGAAVLLVGTVAQARPDDSYRSAQDGNWNQKATWEIRAGDPPAWQSLSDSDTVPNEGDTATILNTHSVNVSDSQGIMNLTVSSGGELVIDGTGVLNFNGSGTPLLTINESNDGVKVANNGVLKVSKSMSIAGASGKLLGQGNAASIGIAPDNVTAVTLTLTSTFHGRMIIQQSGSGTASVNFVNQGFVIADAAGNIELASTLDSVTDTATVDGCATPRWIVETNGSANLIFNVQATGLAGFFFVDEGVLQINQDVTTSGKLTFMSGSDINVAASMTFTFSGGVCPGSSCGSGTSMTGNNNCP